MGKEKKKKYKIQYKTVVFIEKATAYYFEESRTAEEAEFQKRHEKVIDKIAEKYPRLSYDPLNYYQYACSVFSSYTKQEIEWINSTNSDMAKDNAELLWSLLKRSKAMGPGFYLLEKFLDKISIKKQQYKWNKILKKYKNK